MSLLLCKKAVLMVASTAFAFDVQFCRSRPYKISKITAQSSDPYDDPLSNMRQDKQHKSYSQHLECFGSGGDSKQERGSRDKSKQKREKSENPSGKAGQEDPNPLDQHHNEQYWQRNNLRNQLQYQHGSCLL